MMQELEGLPIDHLGIAVADIEAATEPYKLLGFPQLGQDEIVVSQKVKVRALQAHDSLIELLEPTSSDSAIAKFIEKRGAGLHHVAFRVEKIEREVERLSGLGARFISEEPRAGRAGTKVVFLHPKWSKGVLIELVEHSH